MKHFYQLFSALCILAFFTSMIHACRKSANTSPEEPGNPGDNTNIANADSIASHLLFSNATKLTGTIPKGSTESSLKISFKDTLYLMDKIMLPIEFLHEGATKNVAGVYMQVYVGGSGGIFYYNVPEVPDVATNDSISVVLIGIDLDGLIDTSGVPPAGSAPPFEIAIAPYDSSGQPLDEITVPVNASSPETDPTGGQCGLVTKEGEYWAWHMSYIVDPDDQPRVIRFFNSPNKLWGLTGQIIEGCCTDGVSSYTANCAAENKRSLFFQTFLTGPTKSINFLRMALMPG
ncbi:hypothetical protein [Parafilimonas sp.]|uniref:hypothetical protein n=1 Tax=Parafilimonas sp. TaxID=1969739 RepID=UPI0039E6DD30